MARENPGDRARVAAAVSPMGHAIMVLSDRFTALGERLPLNQSEIDMFKEIDDGLMQALGVIVEAYPEDWPK